MPVESERQNQAVPALEVRLLGPLTIVRDGVALALPASRKVRALLAYLALAPAAVTRSQLCELLWDVPNDPRGELRWSLSKIRGLVDTPDRRRVETQHDAVRLDLTDCFVDAMAVARAIDAGVETLTPERKRTLSRLFNGEVLEGLDIDRSPGFNGWLTAQRRRFRGCHAALLEHLVRHVPDDEALGHLEKWLQLAPFDRRVHELLLTARPHPRRRGASRGDHETVRSRRPRRRARSRRLARGPRADRRRARARHGARRRQRPRRHRPDGDTPRLHRRDAVHRPIRHDG